MRGDVQDGGRVQRFEGGFGRALVRQDRGIRQGRVDARGLLGCAFERRVTDLCEINAAKCGVVCRGRILAVSGIGLFFGEPQSATGLAVSAGGDRLTRQVVGRVGEDDSAGTVLNASTGAKTLFGPGIQSKPIANIWSKENDFPPESFLAQALASPEMQRDSEPDEGGRAADSNRHDGPDEEKHGGERRHARQPDDGNCGDSLPLVAFVLSAQTESHRPPVRYQKPY